jgi:phospholipid/cholesterol/gamma-HCH transport system substrate-binding protein
MSRSVIETVLGGLVLIGAAIFLFFSYSKGDAGEVSGYQISANFSKIGGLKSGDPVQISGVKIGQVANVILDSKTYLAKVTMEIDSDVKVPDDSAATISSQSLLGGMVMGIEPGGSEDMLKSGGEIQYTQAPQNLEELLGKFIFSMQDKDKEAPADTTTPESKGLVLEPENQAQPNVGIPESP